MPGALVGVSPVWSRGVDLAGTAGITVYTIQVNTGGDPTSTLLQNCASDSTKFWMLTSASAINATFSAIGTNLTQLRVAK